MGTGSTFNLRSEPNIPSVFLVLKQLFDNVVILLHQMSERGYINVYLLL